MAVVLNDLLMRLFTKVIIKMVKDMVKAILNLQTLPIIEETFLKEIYKDKEFLNGLMEVNLEVNG